MRHLWLAVLALMIPPTLAAQQPLFDRYESVRQALLRGDIQAVQNGAAKLGELSSHAPQLARATDIKTARAAFALVSQDAIAYRNRIRGPRPAVLYCSMEKKSWLQPAPSPVANPYLDAKMRTCGQTVR